MHAYISNLLISQRRENNLASSKKTWMCSVRYTGLVQDSRTTETQIMRLLSHYRWFPVLTGPGTGCGCHNWSPEPVLVAIVGPVLPEVVPDPNP